MHVNNYYRPIDHWTRFTNHFLVNTSVYCGKISCSCCNVRKDVVMGLYTLTFTLMLSSLRFKLFAYFLACHPYILLHFFLFFYSCSISVLHESGSRMTSESNLRASNFHNFPRGGHAPRPPSASILTHTLSLYLFVPPQGKTVATPLCDRILLEIDCRLYLDTYVGYYNLLLSVHSYSATSRESTFVDYVGMIYTSKALLVP